MQELQERLAELGQEAKAHPNERDLNGYLWDIVEELIPLVGTLAQKVEALEEQGSRRVMFELIDG